MTLNTLPSSFRDPNGFVFSLDGNIYRQINKIYSENYNQLMSSQLYEKLVNEGLLIPHEEINTKLIQSEDAYKFIKPQKIPFISYPNEWCFSQLKDAALTTLKIQKIAFEHNMILKDSSAYNIQFLEGKPVFIDTLSFEKHTEGEPWVAYKQFCQHFLAPLALMATKDIRLNQLFRAFIDGIPLDLTSTLLPFKSWFKFSLFSHIHLHAKSQLKYADKQTNISSRRKISSIGFNGIIDSLNSSINNLKWLPKGTEWGEYYNNTNYTDSALEEKKKIISSFIDKINPTTLWDLGANTGFFSRLSSERKIPTISFDIDFAAVEKNYLTVVKNNEKNILPLILDLTNPTSSIGWENSERDSFMNRAPTDTAMALALVHHLAISNNLPLEKIAGFLSNICKNLIIEFVPKQDSQVKKLLATREDIFPKYDNINFEIAFKKHFSIEDKKTIIGSERTLYLMKKI